MRNPVVPFQRFLLTLALTLAAVAVTAHGEAAPKTAKAGKAGKSPAPVPAEAMTSASGDLLGLGPIRLSTRRLATGEGISLFSCQNAAYADRLIGKLIADFTWDKTTGPSQVSLPGGAPGYQLASGAVIVFVRDGASVYALSAESQAAATSLLNRLRLTGGKVRFSANGPYPRSLDYYDLRPLDMNYSPFGLEGQDLQGKWWNKWNKDELDKAQAFWAPYGFGSNILPGDTMFGFAGVCDAPIGTFPLDYTEKLGLSHGSSVIVHLGNGLAPYWMRNLFPTEIQHNDPYDIPAYSPLGCGSGTWLDLSASDEAYAYVQAFTQHVFEKVKAVLGDNLSALRPYGGGRPGDELGLHHESTEYMEYDEAGQRGFRNWLRDDCKLDLAALGVRWFGDAGHFKSWDDVAIPSNFEFFGGFGDADQTLNLLTGWSWRPDRRAAASEGWSDVDYVPGAGWRTINLAPAGDQMTIGNNQPDDAQERGGGKQCWFRKEVDLTDWLASHKHSSYYLVANTLAEARVPQEVWINGVYLGKIRTKVAWCGPIGMDVTALLHPGKNVICLKVASGIIYGPVFLTTEEPKRYPYLGALRNARYCDLRDWIVERMVKSWNREAIPLRRLAPDLPFLLPSGGAAYADLWLSMKQTAGLTDLHDTGGFASSYSPFSPGLGVANGLYTTNEEGGTLDNEDGQAREVAWILFEGLAHHNWVFNGASYVGFEQKTHWFANHKRMLALVAKSVRSKPSIAILRSPRMERYFPYNDSAVSWDIGRGGLQAAHFNNAYVTDTEVENGMVDQFPVLFDAGTSVMSPDLVAGIERYVRAGGTFVALQNTGRSTLVDADTWPIAALSGFKVDGERQNAMVTIVEGNPLLKKLAGMKFPGTGVVINWMGIDHGKDALPVALSADAPECVPLATWEDGKIAAGMRRLGKGRVIVLGSSFWANKSDLKGNGFGEVGSIQTAFLNDLFTGLGIAKDVDVNSESVWARRVETKNGLQDWFMLWNSGRSDRAGLELTFPAAAEPKRVLDILTGQPVPFKYAGGLVHVSDVAIKVNDMRVFGIDNAQPSDAPSHWFAVKTKYESRVHPAPEAKPFVPPTPQTVVLDKFQFRQVSDAEVKSVSWFAESPTGPQWHSVGYGFWDDYGYSNSGTGVYRENLAVPKAWVRQKVFLSFASWDEPVVFGKWQLYVNGHAVDSPYMGQPPNLAVDITPYVNEGANDIAIQTWGSPHNGLSGTVFAYSQRDLTTTAAPANGLRILYKTGAKTVTALPVNGEAWGAEGMYDIPADWDKHQIYLDLDQGSARWAGTIIVNSHPITYNWYLHPWPNKFRINLYPWAEPGKTNKIGAYGGPTFTLQSMTVGTLSNR